MRLSKPARHSTVAILTALLAAQIAGHTLAAEPAPFREALRHLERGDDNGAIAALQNITGPRMAIDALVDKRFAPIWERFEATTAGNVAAVAQREIDEAAEERRARPRSLEAALKHLGYLRRSRRSAEAVREGSEILRQIVERETNFVDAAPLMSWLLEEVGLAVADEGDMERAHTLMAAAAQRAQFPIGKRRAPAFATRSQRLNSSILLVLDNRPEEALNRVFGMTRGSTTAYVYAVLLFVRTCATSQLSRPGQLETALDALRKRRSRTPGILQDALLCADRQHEGVELLIERLENRGTRRQALRDLQYYLPPKHRPPFQSILIERFDRLRLQPEVQAIVARYGRIRRWNIAEE